MTVLVPSYAEEPEVIRATLWSAALQEYPSMRVVLLLDDPPAPTDPAVKAKLDATRALSRQIMDALAEPRARFTSARLTFELGTLTDQEPGISRGSPARRRVLLGDRLARRPWPTRRSSTTTSTSSSSARCCAASRPSSRAIGDALTAAADAGETPEPERMLELYRRLAWTFDAELATFERKAYASLSHEANKAMNLNSYIGLMGGRYNEEQTPAGTVLRPVALPEAADLVIPDSTYMLTLDADSILLRDYCLRLVYLLEQPQNERVAVTQTPYSSFRGARHSHRAPRRRDDRHPAHPAPGHVVLRRHLLGRRQCRHPQEGPRGHRRDRVATAASRSSATCRTAR